MKKKENTFIPVILGSDITAYSLARSFHEQYGIKSICLCMCDKGYVADSSFIETRYYPDLEDSEVAIGHLIELGIEKGKDKKLILFGCGDWYVRTIIEYKKLLSKYFIVPYIDNTLLDEIVLKDKFYAICEKLGLDYPKTYVYDCSKDTADPLNFDFSYPVIAKPADSARYHYAEFEGKKKIFRFENEAELREMLNNVKRSSYNYKFLIQEMIPGDDSCMRVLTCYCDRDHKVRFAALGHTLIEDPTPSAIGNPVAILNEVNPEIIEAATKFLEHIGYVGFANFDLKYDERDGRYKFFEINVRLGRSNFYVTGSGFNNVKWIVDEYIENHLPEYTIANKEFIYSVVPRSVIKKYVHDGKLKEHALELWAKGRLARPLFYKGEKSLRSKLYAYGNYFNYIRKFKRYA